MIDRLKGFFATVPPLYKLAALVVALIIIFAAFKAGDYLRSRELNALRDQNQQLWSDYNRAIGRAMEAEARGDQSAVIGAREKLRADALQSAIDQSKGNVKTIDDKIEKVMEKYDAQKSNLDCTDSADCNRKLCEELRALGYVKDCTGR